MKQRLKRFCGFLVFAGLIGSVNAQLWESEVIKNGMNPNLTSEAIAFDADGGLHAVMGGDNLYYFSFSESGWSLQTVFSKPEFQIYNASVAIDNEGIVHVIFGKGASHTSEYVHAFRMSSGWQTESLITVRDWTYPLRIDSQGALHTIFIDKDDRFIHSVKKGNSWTYTIMPITFYPPLPFSSGNATFDLDSQDRIHIAMNIRNQLSYLFLEGDLWKQETVDYTRGYKISLRLDSQDRPHLAYQSYDNGVPLLKHSERHDDIWETTLLDNENPGSASIALDENDDPHIIFRSKHTLVHQYRSNDLWIKKLINVENSFAESTACAFDEDNRLCTIALCTNFNSISKLTRGKNEWTEEYLWNYGFIDNMISNVDNNNHFQTAFTEFSGHQLEYAIKLDGGWAIDIVEESQGNSIYKPYSLRVDNYNNPHILYKSDSVLVHAERTETGWVKETLTENEAVYSADMAIGADGKVFVLFSTYDDLWFCSRQSGQWVTETFDQGPYVSLSMCLDRSDNPHFAYNKYNPDAGEYESKTALIHMYFDHGNWVKETIYGGNYGSGSEPVTIMMDPGGTLRAGFTAQLRETHGYYTQAFYAFRDEEYWGVQGMPLSVYYYLKFCLNQSGQPCFAYLTYPLAYECLFLNDTNEWLSSTMTDLGRTQYTGTTALCVDDIGNLHFLYDRDGYLMHVEQILPGSGVGFEMPSVSFSEGQECFLRAYLRRGELPQWHLEFYVILEYQQQYWFWPDWNEECHFQYQDVVLPEKCIEIVPEFTFPGQLAPVDGLIFWGALWDNTTSEIIGGADGIGKWEFGFN